MIKKIYHAVLPEGFRVLARLQFNKIISVFYLGKNYRCNVCDKSFRKMKPKGMWKLRVNAECPYCGSLERTRLLLFYLQNETDIFRGEGKSLLHFAPEWSLIPLFKKTPNLKYTTADINPAYADEQIDITNIPYPDESFDYIICSHVLGHVPDEAKAISEMQRVLKKGGTALIQSIVNWESPETYENEYVKTDEERLSHYSEPDLLRLHGRDFPDRLAMGGFEVESIDYRAEMDEETRRLYSLGDGEREAIFRCTKHESEELRVKN